MDLRAVQAAAALLAGRTASRWAATATPTTALFARHLSSTRARAQEAEALAPEDPTPSSSSSSPSPPQHEQQQQQPPAAAAAAPKQGEGGGGGQQPSRHQQIMPRSLYSPSYSLFPSSSSAAAGAPARYPKAVASWAQPPGTSSTPPTMSAATKELLRYTEVPDGLGAGGGSGHERMPRNPVTQPFPEDIKLRLRPVIGRGVRVDREKNDFAYALTILSTKISANRVAADFRAQKFHERPGLKRKRLKSQRWRANFKLGFRATCDRVAELAKQGW